MSLYGKYTGEGWRASIAVEQTVGGRDLHDMTRIIEGESKGPAVHFGQVINAGDVCRLQKWENLRFISKVQDN